MSIEQDNAKDGQNVPAQASDVTLNAGVRKHYHPEESEGQKIGEAIGNAFGQAQTGVKNPEIQEGHHHHDTLGLKIFDKVIWNFSNIAVFLLSVYSTYKSNFSQPQNTPIEKQNWWMKRGNQVRGILESKGMSKEAARNANMILWSFLDGSIMAPIVAIIEHNRSRIGRTIDSIFGTKPKDESVYEDQPKQGWKSVIMGRLSAFSIVIPTYFLLNIKDKNDPKSLSINNIIFDKPADAAVKNNVAGITTSLSKRFNKEQVSGIVNSSIFETFYTTLCTTILFFVSSLTGRKDREKAEKTQAENTSASYASNSSASNTEAINSKDMQSETKDREHLRARKISEPPASMAQRVEQEASSAPANVSI